MDDDARPRSRAAGNCDLEALRGRKQPLQRPGRAVTQQRPRAAREHGRHPPRIRRQGEVPDSEDAHAKAEQPPTLDTPPDRVLREPQLAQLRPRDNAMLAARQLGDCRIGGVIGVSVAICATRVDHTPQGAPARVTCV
jgi:hypothetical protein